MKDFIVGNYKTTELSFVAGTRKITVWGIADRFDLSTIKMMAVQGNGSNNGFLISAPTAHSAAISQPMPGACTAGVPTAGGSVTAGAHHYKVVFIFKDGSKTLGGAASNQITTDATNKTVALTNIPVGPAGTVAREIYRTNAGGTDYYLVSTIYDNTTTTYSDTSADNTTVLMHSISQVYDIDYSASLRVLAADDQIFIYYQGQDLTEDLALGVIKTVVLNEPKLPAADPDIAIISETNLTVNANPYYRSIVIGKYENCCIQIKATCATASSIIKVYATLDNAIADTADAAAAPSVDWVDITNLLFGSDTLSVPTTGTLTPPVVNVNVDRNGRPVMWDRIQISYLVANATNFIQVTATKF